MSNPPPLPCTWNGEAFVPLPRIAKLADRHFCIGDEYTLVVEQPRSDASHNHEFAWLAEAWKQLPEDIAESYPSVEHLRKRGLIEAGYYNEQIVDAGSNAAALRVASAFRARDDFLLVIVRGPFVVIREAKSQSRRAMPGKEFQQSKTALMEVVANLISVSPDALTRNSGRAA